jgi:GT2 family glycosyltransferase
MAVVICTNRGPDRLGRALRAVSGQTVRDRLEVVVVDDGSPEPLAPVCAEHGARLVGHGGNRGLAPARNTGLAVTQALLVAFTDDDCSPDPVWAEELIEAFADPAVVSAGGPVVSDAGEGIIHRYYQANNPLAPLEKELDASPALWWRAWLYAKRNVTLVDRAGDRAVHALPGANFSFRRAILDEVGGFDEGIRFGGEDEDVYHRIHQHAPDGMVWMASKAVVRHPFQPSLGDALRRARAYGRGNARNWAKHPEWRPTLFPAPLLCLAFLAAGWRRPRWAALAAGVPLVTAPRWFVLSWRTRSPEPLAYAYLQTLQEGASNVGFVQASASYVVGERPVATARPRGSERQPG